MSETKDYLFIGLKIVVWGIFVGLCIEAGALLVNFVISLYKPEIVQNLYQKLDLSEMYSRSRGAYFSVYSFILAISVLKASLFYIVIKLVTDLDLSKPFNNVVSGQIKQISYYTFSIGLLSYIARETAQNMANRGYEVNQLNQFWADSQAFLLMAAILYIIASIFQKGVDLQQENDLTV